MKRIALAMVICCVLPAPALVAAPTSLPMPLPRFVASAQVLSAPFNQSGNGPASSGRVWLGPDGRVRWEQAKPYAMLSVSNGKVGWQVEYDLNQAIRFDPKQMEGWASLFGAEQFQQIASGTWESHAPGRPDITVHMGPTGPSSITVEGQSTTQFGAWVPVKPPEFSYTPSAGMDVLGSPIAE